jgi:hypothetical protein
MNATPVRNCEGCRYWSELIAASAPETGHEFKALCLNKVSPKYSAYTAPREICSEWKSGHLGAIDTPGRDVPALYRKEEQAP